MPVANHQNPGTTNPADQSYPAVIAPSAPRTPSSASTVNSTGDMQLPSQLTTRAAPSTSRGLAANVDAGSASQVRTQPPTVAETRPPARNITANTSRPGGLPINVIIR